MSTFEVIATDNGHIVKMWSHGVPFETNTIEQLKKTASMPFLFHHLAAMPDAHLGVGSTIGTVFPTLGAICPATCGVDIGCGMMATHTTLKRKDFADLHAVRLAIEAAVPCGRTNNGGQGDRGAWGTIPPFVQGRWDLLFDNDYDVITMVDPGAKARNTVNQLGTLGSGNHFIELSEDENGDVWIVLHSGSRGLGNKIGTYFTSVAQKLCEKFFIALPDKDLAYLPVDTQEFRNYKRAVELAQRFAWENRLVMMENIKSAIGGYTDGSVCFAEHETVHCHHNYISWERHFGKDITVTRKGAVRAQVGDMGIIPGSMGAKTFIVRGLGNRESFCTCSHGAGRTMGRREAERRFTVEQHALATSGIECDKTASTLDETPACYKDIDSVMAAQSDLVEIVHTLKQFVNVKGQK
jgi:tRNA-splicing ligase RtcB